MAHFAQIDGSNVVLRVIVVDNAHEADGANWCSNFLGGTWVQTSYNDNIRKNFAGIGYTYDAGRDAFVAPKPYPSWALDEATWQWQAPVVQPEGPHRWNEATQNWDAVEGLP